MPLADWALVFSGRRSRNRLEPDYLSRIDEYRHMRLRALQELGLTGPFESYFLGPLEGLKQFQGHPWVLAQNAVLNDNVVVAVETTGLPVVLVDHVLSVVGQEFLYPGVP